ncbi:MAG: ADP-ribosylglycohydrolase family protein [bacterium]|jgi:ADP-ribosylglycohydrolase|nr:ADP-ribosylglycohydrolase family protein [bacterium]
MLGAIIGDVIGSIFEFNSILTKNFELFTEKNELTDDSYLTIAVFLALEKCNGNYEKLSSTTAREFMKIYIKYPDPMGGYGTMFADWVLDCLEHFKIVKPYNSFGNGSAMRVSPVPYFSVSLEHCIDLTRKVTKITHNHEEGLKGAEATAVAIYLALNKHSKEDIKNHIINNYYPLNESLADIRKYYKFDGSCQGSVPQSIQAFMESNSYEDAIRNVISLGGDADTMAAITGSIAEAYYGIPSHIQNKLSNYLDGYTKDIINRMKMFSKSVKE